MENLHTESLQNCFKDLVTEEQHRIELRQTNIQLKSNYKLFYFQLGLQILCCSPSWRFRMSCSMAEPWDLWSRIIKRWSTNISYAPTLHYQLLKNGFACLMEVSSWNWRFFNCWEALSRNKYFCWVPVVGRYLIPGSGGMRLYLHLDLWSIHYSQEHIQPQIYMKFQSLYL